MEDWHLREGQILTLCLTYICLYLGFPPMYWIPNHVHPLRRLMLHSPKFTTLEKKEVLPEFSR